MLSLVQHGEQFPAAWAPADTGVDATDDLQQLSLADRTSMFSTGQVPPQAVLLRCLLAVTEIGKMWPSFKGIDTVNQRMKQSEEMLKIVTRCMQDPHVVKFCQTPTPDVLKTFVALIVRAETWQIVTECLLGQDRKEPNIRMLHLLLYGGTDGTEPIAESWLKSKVRSRLNTIQQAIAPAATVCDDSLVITHPVCDDSLVITHPAPVQPCAQKIADGLCEWFALSTWWTVILYCCTCAVQCFMFIMWGNTYVWVWECGLTATPVNSLAIVKEMCKEGLGREIPWNLYAWGSLLWRKSSKPQQNCTLLYFIMFMHTLQHFAMRIPNCVYRQNIVYNNVEFGPDTPLLPMWVYALSMLYIGELVYVLMNRLWVSCDHESRRQHIHYPACAMTIAGYLIINGMPCVFDSDYKYIVTGVYMLFYFFRYIDPRINNIDVLDLKSLLSVRACIAMIVGFFVLHSWLRIESEQFPLIQVLFTSTSYIHAYLALHYTIYWWAMQWANKID